MSDSTRVSERSDTEPKGHVARSIAKGKRPYLTATIAPSTYRALDRLCALFGLSRGRMIDRLVENAEENGT